ncbi:MAG: MarR family winged helix-turn-helix transcriptional regulator [Pseudomonadota bacterium]
MTNNEGQDLKPEERLAEAIRTLLRVLTVNAQDKNGDGRLDLSGTELHLLGRVLEEPGLMAKEVAFYLGLTPTTVQSIIERLEKRGLLKRGPHPNDGRAIALSLTDTGETTITNIHARDIENSALMLSMLPPERQKAFTDDLMTIAQAVTRRFGEPD